MGEKSLMQIALSRADFVLVVFENLNLPSPSSGHSSVRKMVSLLLPDILQSMIELLLWSTRSISTERHFCRSYGFQLSV